MIESVQVETVNEAYGYMNAPKPGSAGSDGGKLAVDRLKFNLKPRSQPPEHLEVNAKRDRYAMLLIVVSFLVHPFSWQTKIWRMNAMA